MYLVKLFRFPQEGQVYLLLPPGLYFSKIYLYILFDFFAEMIANLLIAIIYRRISKLAIASILRRIIKMANSADCH